MERLRQFVTYEKLIAKDLDLYYPEISDSSGATPLGRSGVRCTYARARAAQQLLHEVPAGCPRS